MRQGRSERGPIGVALLGYGYWGPNLARNFAENERFRLAAIVDPVPARRRLAARRHPDVRVAADEKEVLADETVEAVAVAAPVALHHRLGKAALQAGKHLLVTKPMTRTVREARDLVATARRKKRVLLVDHTFVYTPAVRRLVREVRARRFGRPWYYHSIRTNLGLFQSDVDVVWDLAPHDLSILARLRPGLPREVSAVARSHAGSRHADFATITLSYDENFTAVIQVSWISPAKVRLVFVGGSRRMIQYDDTEADEKIRIYDKGVTFTRDGAAGRALRAEYRFGAMHAPRLKPAEALAVEVAHFARCIREGARPETPGEDGLRVVRILDAITRSAKRAGRPVRLA